ncbi:Uncharacterized protein APZ42_018601 [Daphnia magna]|uniref:Uncharacterized protein n=1 Tax=Daphnia magna TaxID=35525 RepID=A0A0P5LT11_9CRUS|nr:Uncharacterized protein APZ42_018601 [Daphnia magna]
MIGNLKKKCYRQKSGKARPMHRQVSEAKSNACHQSMFRVNRNPFRTRNTFTASSTILFLFLFPDKTQTNILVSFLKTVPKI